MEEDGVDQLHPRKKIKSDIEGITTTNLPLRKRFSSENIQSSDNERESNTPTQTDPVSPNQIVISPIIMSNPQNQPPKGEATKVQPQIQPLHCVCGKSQNLEQEQLQTIPCDICGEIFHLNCVSSQVDSATTPTKYTCNECREELELVGSNEIIKEISTVSDKAKCLYKYCSNLAKSNSKYCSPNCGVLNAKDILTEKTLKRELNQLKRQQKQILVNKTEYSEADKEDLKCLDNILQKKIAIHKTLLDLQQKDIELQKAIELSSSLTNNTTQYSDANMDDSEKRPSALEIIDCITCGMPIPIKNLSRHTEQCFSKKGLPLGSQRSRGESAHLLCGCPTNEFSGGYCERLKKSCPKHVNWENLRKSHLMQEKKRQNTILLNTLNEEKINRGRIIRRNLSTTDVNVKTIVENS